jgi:hypothetical protein
MNLGALASRRRDENELPELAGETPALPGMTLRFRGSRRESVRKILSPPGGGMAGARGA